MSVVYKCKICGGEIQPNEDGRIGKCLYCGAVQTLPKEKDDKVSNILNRANDYRLNCDFDRAIYEYEKVMELDETEPEAHWGLFLSKYGVEYVKDNMTFSYKPTLHRISSISVFDDVDYQATIKYASDISAIQYKQDAENIENVMKELLLISTNQEPYDIFLSYKELDDVTRQRTIDSNLAYELYNALTAQGYKVFFAPKSLGVGLYEPKIYSAIITSKVMIVLGTQPQYFNAVWVKNEWSRFAELVENGENKVIIPVFRDMEANQLPSRIAKYQAYDMSNIEFLPSILNVISQSVSKNSKVAYNKDASAEDVYLERGFLALEDGNFSQADSFFENVLNLNPHNSQAYFGKLMVEMKITKQEQILTSPKNLSEYKNFEKAVRFADYQLKTTLLKYEEDVSFSLNQIKYTKCVEELKNVVTKEGLIKAKESFLELGDFKSSTDYVSKIDETLKEYEINESQMMEVNKQIIKLAQEKVNAQNKKTKSADSSIFTILLMIAGVIADIVFFIMCVADGADNIIGGILLCLLYLAIGEAVLFGVGRLLDITIGKLLMVIINSGKNAKYSGRVRNVDDQIQKLEKEVSNHQMKSTRIISKVKSL